MTFKYPNQISAAIYKESTQRWMCIHAKNVELLIMYKGCICWIPTSNICTIDNYPLSEADAVPYTPLHTTEPNVTNLSDVRATSLGY